MMSFKHIGGCCAGYLSSSPVFHRLTPHVCKWFISLARREEFTAAIWKASGDVGYQGYVNFLLGKEVGVVTSAQEMGAVPEQQPLKAKQCAGKQQQDGRPSVKCKPEKCEKEQAVRREGEGGREGDEGRRGREGEGGREREEGEGEGGREREGGREEGEGGKGEEERERREKLVCVRYEQASAPTSFSASRRQCRYSVQ